jgi:hypothetical protein
MEESELELWCRMLDETEVMSNADRAVNYIQKVSLRGLGDFNYVFKKSRGSKRVFLRSYQNEKEKKREMYNL